MRTYGVRTVSISTRSSSISGGAGEAGYCNGATLVVDGGCTARSFPG
jgi:hypothetical protein